jgi:hypothetical protein
MQDDPSACVSVYHTQASPHDFAERDAAAWLRFGLDVMAAHQPDGTDTCTGCGRIWDCCPVVVAACQQGLSKHLVEMASRPGGLDRATRSGGFPTW